MDRSLADRSQQEYKDVSKTRKACCIFQIFALMMAVTMGCGLISCSSQTPGNAEAETPVDQASEAATSESTSNTYTTPYSVTEVPRIGISFVPDAAD